MKSETTKNFLEIILMEFITTFAKNKNQQRVNKLQMFKINQFHSMLMKIQLQKEETIRKNQLEIIKSNRLHKQKKEVADNYDTNAKLVDKERVIIIDTA